MDRSKWVHKAGAGRFQVWHAGKNLYFIVDEKTGDAVDSAAHFGTAVSKATHHDRLSKYEREEDQRKAITDYYTDRANSGLAALAR